MKILLCSLALALLTASSPAAACTITLATPEKAYKGSSSVVLAAPIAMATSPSNALSESFKGSFEQTIQWQVLVRWKGSYKVGAVFTTITKHESGSFCGDGAQRRYEIMLLYLSGREPFSDFLAKPPVLSVGDFKFLSKARRGG